MIAFLCPNPLKSSSRQPTNRLASAASARSAVSSFRFLTALASRFRAVPRNRLRETRCEKLRGPSPPALCR